MNSAGDEITGAPWTQTEVERIVATYFHMLRLQELGQRPNKSEQNRRLQQLLPARSLTSIEYKHRNISAVMHTFGAQNLNGYKPLPNVQNLLYDVVGRFLAEDKAFNEAAISRVEMPAEVPVLDNFEKFLVDPPRPARGDSKPARGENQVRLPVRRDYLEREANNRSLGLAGELLVMEYEARRLHGLGAHALCDRIEHSSRARGDGLGYDILSFEPNGRERFIEVKTTAYSAETPFFVSRNEVLFSKDQSDHFHLYRLFAFRQHPQMFALKGSISSNCRLDATTYRAVLSDAGVADEVVVA